MKQLGWILSVGGAAALIGLHFGQVMLHPELTESQALRAFFWQWAIGMVALLIGWRLLAKHWS